MSPGATLTAMVEKNTRENPEVMKSYMERIPLKRMAKPESIASAVLFLVSPEADDITGQEMVVDDGLSALHPGYVEPKG